MGMNADVILTSLINLSDHQKAQQAMRFFKTAKGEYGEGDKFLGISMPILRQQVKHFNAVSLDDLCCLLANSYHEVRMFALLAMVQQFKRASGKRNYNQQQRKAIYSAYMQYCDHINNWDLVDCSAYWIVGPYLHGSDCQPLLYWAKTGHLWQRRIAMVSCYHFIRQGQFTIALEICELLVHDKHDLIQKAVGWMLREIGNRDRQTEIEFLNNHYQSMPRTMLRYAIEKFDEELRQGYLKGQI
ncbi:DNA alkylation repair protein [Thalassotalea sp. Y01]|uniref:DNA alkylation repair protein n=1 Tax=Thalassotalea sp. Y01 TaxID=2729613 RepID=UPI00145ED42D|nr:DNA alkylation repair protein [Thalassotalea sp. Y01]NMP15382.1 DNA alkylation repair protein [Thalassotalea sp. Y01]